MNEELRHQLVNLSIERVGNGFDVMRSIDDSINYLQINSAVTADDKMNLLNMINNIVNPPKPTDARDFGMVKAGENIDLIHRVTRMIVDENIDEQKRKAFLKSLKTALTKGEAA